MALQEEKFPCLCEICGVKAGNYDIPISGKYPISNLVKWSNVRKIKKKLVDEIPEKINKEEEEKADSIQCNSESLKVNQVFLAIFGLAFLPELGDEQNEQFWNLYNKSDSCQICYDCHQTISALYNSFEDFLRIVEKTDYLSKCMKLLLENVILEKVAQPHPPQSKRILKRKWGKTKASSKLSTVPIKKTENEDPETNLDINKQENRDEPFTLPALNLLDEIKDEPQTQLEIASNELSPKVRCSSRMRKRKEQPDFQEFAFSKSTQSKVVIDKGDTKEKKQKTQMKNFNFITALWNILSTDLMYYNDTNLARNSEGKYLCPESKCMRLFTGLTTLNRHTLSHDLERIYTCAKCSKDFQSLQEIKLHLKEVHLQRGKIGRKPRPVKVSTKNKIQKLDGVELVRNEQLSPSKVNDSDLGESKRKDNRLIHPPTCAECNKVFTRRDHLKRHIDMIHNAKPKILKKRKQKAKYHCLECDKEFTKKECFLLHNRIHTGEKPFLCTLCGKTFRDRRNLSQHHVTHKSDRPFCCSICGMTFKRAQHLHDHEEGHREDIPRPYVCSEPNCGKAFKLRKHLATHELVHSGAKDHRCHVCGKAFSRKDNLRQHIMKVHGKDFAEDLLKHLQPHPPLASILVESTLETSANSPSAIT